MSLQDIAQDSAVFVGTSVASLAVGAIATVWFQSARSKSQTSREQRRIAEYRRRDAMLGKAALDFYARVPTSPHVYHPTFVNGHEPIPMVFDREWTVAGRVNPFDESFIELTDERLQRFPVDDFAISRRTDSGARIWDGRILYLTRVGERDGQPYLGAGVCNYYSYVTVAEQIQNAFRKPRAHASKRILRTWMSSTDGQREMRYAPICLAASTVCLFETPDGPRVLLSTRSDEVVNALDSTCVLPTFGMEPHVADGVPSKYGLLFYNFAKEFMEEVYGVKELETEADSPALNRDKIFDSALADELVEQFTTGEATLDVTGMGIEATDGTITYALLARFSSHDFYERVRGYVQPNFESKRRPDSPHSIHFLRLDDNALVGLSKMGEMSATSMFAVDLALVSVATPDSGL